MPVAPDDGRTRRRLRRLTRRAGIAIILAAIAACGGVADSGIGTVVDTTDEAIDTTDVAAIPSTVSRAAEPDGPFWLIAAVSIDGEELDDPDSYTARPTLRLDGSTITGNTGCSELSGTITKDSDGQPTYDVAVVGPPCGPDDAAREQAILTALNDGAWLDLHGGVLIYGIEDVAAVALFAVE